MTDPAVAVYDEAKAREAEALSKRKPLVSILLHVLLIVASIIMLYPLLWMLSASFRPEEEIFSSTSLIPSQISLEAYPRGWFGLRVDFGTFFWNSFAISIWARSCCPTT
jgi:multiple sugar transport system permease protein